MILTIELTHNEYVATQKALGKVAALRTLHTVPNVIERLELEHLRTLLAEASINSERRCNACNQTAERCTRWGGDCCPLCTHQKASA